MKNGINIRKMRMHQCFSGNTYALELLHHEASSYLIVIILWLQDFSAVLDDYSLDKIMLMMALMSAMLISKSSFIS